MQRATRLALSVSARSSTTAASLAVHSGSRRAASTWHKPGIQIEFPDVKQARVEEAIVNITFVNYAGERTTLPGRVGDTLYSLARRYKYDYLDPGCGGGGSPQEKYHKEGSWFEPKYGEGAQCYFCHVIVPKSHYDLLPPRRPDEADQLSAYPFKEDMAETSRLACQVTLTKELDGMVCYVPDGPPSDIP